MKKYFRPTNVLLTEWPGTVLLLVILLNWIPIITVPFINDDYQILGYHFNKGLISVIQPFWKSDISLYYWRPVGNMLHPLILLVGGFHPLLFRIVSLLIYYLCCMIFMIMLEKIGLNKNISLIAALIFAILPSHELQVAWIADQGEALFTILLVLTFINYYEAIESGLIKKYLLAAIFFLIAALIKETAFAGVLIPLIALALKSNKNKKIIQKCFLHVILAVFLVAGILIYRYFIIGGTPINQVHFGSSNPFIWLINFFIYIPLSFVPPEMLEQMQNVIHNKSILVLVVLLLISLIYFFLKVYKKLDHGKKRILLAGFLWYVIFVIPALPNLMRWYVFTSSLGLLIIVGVILEKLYLDLDKSKIFTSIFVLVVISISFYNFSLMVRWNEAGNKLQSALQSIKDIKVEIKQDTIYIWAVPDKLDRIPMMKLGVKETIQWALDNKKIEVYSPLRVELLNADTKIKLISCSDSNLILQTDGGRFLRERSESRSIITDELLEFNYEGNNYRIETKNGTDGKPNSKVTVNFGNEFLNKNEQLYFDGEKFVKIKML